MITCGKCGQSTDASDVTCSHCGALLAAWESATEVGQSDQQNRMPDYARPPADTSLLTPVDRRHGLTTPGKGDFGQVINSNPAGMGTVDQATATRLVNTISAYIRKREAESELSRSTASQRQDRSTGENNRGTQISNLVFAIGTVLVVVLVLMWGIVAAMVFTDMLSIEFIAITIVLTLAFKPTMDNLRRIFEK